MKTLRSELKIVFRVQHRDKKGKFKEKIQQLGRIQGRPIRSSGKKE